MNNIIWVFREHRSGSTWFIKKIAYLLKRPDNFLEMPEKLFLARKQTNQDSKEILNTHNFVALKSLKNYTNPIVIRVSRKNKTEQFISEYIANHRRDILKSPIWNIKSEKEIDEFANFKNIEIPLDQAVKFMLRLKEYDELWNTNTANTINETIYYEDMLNGYNVKSLNNIYVKMKDVEDQRQLTWKLPYNKKDIILNYKEINEYFNTGG